MIGLTRIQIHVPDGRQTLENCATELGLNSFEARMFERLHGLKHFITAEHASLGDHLAAAQPEPEASTPVPDHIFHCHTIPAITPVGAAPLAKPDQSILSGMTMAHCAGPLVILNLLSETLKTSETARIIIGEKSFHPKIKLIPNVTIMSEISVSIDVTHEPSLCQWIDSETRISGKVAINSGLDDHGGVPDCFEEEYRWALRESVFSVLERQGMTWSDLEWVFPHNVNLSSWRIFAKKNGVDLSKIYLSNVPRFAHAYGADPFINFDTALSADEIGPGDRALLVSVGLGLTANATLIEVPTPKQLNMVM